MTEMFSVSENSTIFAIGPYCYCAFEPLNLLLLINWSFKSLLMTIHNTIYQVDAFTSEPFKGNPAGICILDAELSVSRMQNIAMEMNLAETAFLLPVKNGYKVRFFTPLAEVPLCGHASLAASHILYETGMVNIHEKIRFSCRAGELIIKKHGNWITMNFPVYQLEKIGINPEFKRVTGVHPVELYRTDSGWILALLNNEEEVKNLKPDFSQMKNSKFGDLIVTAESDDQKFDFCVRCFAPVLGIDEDPVTGSAQCALVPFWKMKTGRNDFVVHQISKRSGILKVSMKDERVEISGHAKTIFKAEMYV
jgi:PhzF family phenazine biosynthesis protein